MLTLQCGQGRLYCSNVPTNNETSSRGWIRVLTLVEATTVAGAVKPVIEFACQSRHADRKPPVEMILVTYIRRTDENVLTCTIRDYGLPLELIKEAGPFDPRIIPQLIQIVDHWKPDIICTHSSKSHFLVRLIGLNRKAKWIAFFHGYTREAVRTRFYNQLDRWSWRAADCLVTTCKYFVQQCKDIGIPDGRIRLQPTPIRQWLTCKPEDRWSFRNQLGVDDETLVVLSVGRLSKEKGHVDLIRAISILRQQRKIDHALFVIVGDGPESKRIRALSTTLSVDEYIMFAGQQQDVRNYYSSADLFVLPSHSEGLPNVVLEAFNARLPIIATRVGGLPEVLESEVNAILVPAQDPSSLADAIYRVMIDKDLRSALSLAGTAILEQHTVLDYFHSVSNMFEEVLSRVS